MSILHRHVATLATHKQEDGNQESHWHHDGQISLVVDALLMGLDWMEQFPPSGIYLRLLPPYLNPLDLIKKGLIRQWEKERRRAYCL